MSIKIDHHVVDIVNGIFYLQSFLQYSCQYLLTGLPGLQENNVVFSSYCVWGEGR